MKQKCVSRAAHIFTVVNRVVVGPKSSVSVTRPHDQCLVWEVRVASRGQEILSFASQGDRFKCISCVPRLERNCISCVPGCQLQI